MWCTLTRWKISRAEETGKELPRFAERHVRRCGFCREFASSSASMASRLRAERSAWLAKVPDFPVRTMPGVDDMLMERGSVVEAGRRLSRPRIVFRPLPAAIVILVIAAGAFILFRIAGREPAVTAQDRAAAVAAIRSLSNVPEGLGAVVGEAESSLDQERRILERSVADAVEYLQARLNVRIERKATPKSS